MANRSTQKSIREVGRFIAVDENGIAHTVVERVKVVKRIGLGGYFDDAARGNSHYYSMTTGDTLYPLKDGWFEGRHGKPRLQRPSP